MQQKLLLITAVAVLGSLATGATACHRGSPHGPSSGCTPTEPEEPNNPPSTISGAHYKWMDADVATAFQGKYFGENTTITVVDDYAGGVFEGRLVTTDGVYETVRQQTHGGWTSEMAGLIAPGATVVRDEWDSGPVRFGNGFNVANLSYGLLGSIELAPSDINRVRFSKRDDSLIKAATDGTAVVVKSAGNDYGFGVGDWVMLNYTDGTTARYQDWLSLALLDTQSALFVGAVDWNVGADEVEPGTTTNLAYYSTAAGTLAWNQYLVVGVEAGTNGDDQFANYGANCGTVDGHCLYGTSFAAPIVSGYAAILGAKHASATPKQIVDQLLRTARTDTLYGFGLNGLTGDCAAVSLTGVCTHSFTYGAGEASLVNALGAIAAPK